MKLSIIISERNDPFGCLLTIRSVMESLKSCSFTSEIIIVDNSEDLAKRQTLYDLFDAFTTKNEVKIIEQNFACLFSARDLAVQHSTGEYILILDSHCLVMKNAINKLVTFADRIDNLGILFGLMCYSSAHELDAFCDRDVEKFTGLRLHGYKTTLPYFKSPLRSMPMVIKRSVWEHIRGYYPLSTHRLCWGGGDFLISFKPLLFGYSNWSLTTAGVVHLGPFNDGGFFTASYIDKASPNNPRFLGMLVAAYVIGGEELLDVRFSQLLNRADEKYLKRVKNRVFDLCAECRRWINKNTKVSYDSIVTQFKGKQSTTNLRIYKQDASLFPIATKVNKQIDKVYKPKVVNSMRLL